MYEMTYEVQENLLIGAWVSLQQHRWKERYIDSEKNELEKRGGRKERMVETKKEVCCCDVEFNHFRYVIFVY